MSFFTSGIVPVVPTYHPNPPADNGDRNGKHTHISSSLESVGRVWLAVHEMPEQAYPSLPRIAPVQIALGQGPAQLEQGMREEHKHDTLQQPSTPRLAPPPEGMMAHPSPMRLAPFLVNQKVPSTDEMFTPTPTKSTFGDSQSMISPGLRAEGLKARKESSTLGLVIDEVADPMPEDPGELVHTAKHGSPSRAHMVRLSPLSPKQAKVDLFDSPDSPATKEKLRTPMLPKIQVQFGNTSIEDQPKSPFEAFSPLIAAPPRNAELEYKHDDDVSMRRTSNGGTTDKSGVGPGMTPSLAEIMDRVGVTAQRNRLDIHD